MSLLDREPSPPAPVDEAGAPGRLTSLDGDFDIADLCLLGALSGRDAGIQAGQNGSTSLLAMADGALVHVSSGNLQGLAAFKKILSWSRLDFDWMPAAAARSLTPNVRLDTSWLLKIAQWRQGPEAQAPESCKAEGLLSGIHLQDLLSLLEKKRGTGMVTVTATGCIGALVLQDGQIVQADTDGQHGRGAVEEILTWQALRATYSRTAASAAAHEGGTAMADLEKLIDELAGEIDGVLSSGLVRLSDGQPVLGRSTDPAFASDLAPYAAVMRLHAETAERMGGRETLGGTEDFLISMEKTYLLIRMLGPDHFFALLLARSANPALARFVMQRYEPLFQVALRGV